MPIYEYICTHCHHDFEAFVWNRAEEHGIDCPKCKSREVKRQMSCFATQCSSSGASKSDCGSGARSKGFG